MRVLITGNRGYVGSAVTKYLNKKNIDVYGIDSNLFSKKINKNQTNIDIREINENILDNIDGVVHLAGISNDPMGKKFSKATKSINLNASIKFFKICKKKNIKSFVFASSCSVYGQTKNNVVSENSKLNPLTDYAKSKINFEKIITKGGIGNTNTTFLRFATACGYSENFRRDLVINDLVLNAITKKKILLLSKGTAWRPFIHVNDMARAIYWSLIRKKTKKPVTINTGRNSNNIKVIDVAKKIEKKFKGVKIEIANNAENDKRSYKVDFSKFRKLSGKYYAKYDLNNIIDDLKLNLKKKKNNFNSLNLIRLKKLNKLLEEKKIDNLLKWIDQKK
jgi:nucleoside-diphosphate-sugar epimerase